MKADWDVLPSVEVESDVYALAEAILSPVIIFNADGGVEYVNKRWASHTGYDEGESIGWGWLLALHPDDMEVVRTTLLRTKNSENLQVRLRHAATGTYAWYLIQFGRFRYANSTVQHWIGIFSTTNITERIVPSKRKELEIDLLAEMSDIIAAAYDVRKIFDLLAHLLVQNYADWCMIHVMRPDGSLDLSANAHHDAQHAELTETLIRRYPIREQDEVMKVALTGDHRLISTVTPEIAATFAQDGEHLALLEGLGFRSWLAVPLKKHDRVFGVLQMGRGVAARMFDEGDLQVVQILADRSASAIENAQLHERERRLSNAFQFSALPMSLPQIHGVTMSGLYEPACNEALVGGDWYDALRLADGRLVISIGDVAGSGMEAAVIMVSIRQIIRGVAQIHVDPSEILDAADRTLRAEYPEIFVTAFVGIFDPVTLSLSYASAGHPPPIIRCSDSIMELSERGLPLGVRSHGTDESKVITLPERSLLVLYTDGLTEETHDIVEGEQRLKSVIEHLDMNNDQQFAQIIYDEVLPCGSHDDVAIFTLIVDPRLVGGSRLFCCVKAPS